jgi:hypothetical protein
MKKLLSTNDWFARHPKVCTGAIIFVLYILACSV